MLGASQHSKLYTTFIYSLLGRGDLSLEWRGNCEDTYNFDNAVTNLRLQKDGNEHSEVSLQSGFSVTPVLSRYFLSTTSTGRYARGREQEKECEK